MTNRDRRLEDAFPSMADEPAVTGFVYAPRKGTVRNSASSVSLWPVKRDTRSTAVAGTVQE